MSPDDMTDVVRLAHERGIWVISDECYVYLNYTGKNFSVGSLNEYRDRFLVVGSLSKTYAMTGWRLGFTLGPAAVVGRSAEAAEPVDFESDFDRAEGGGGGAEQFAAVRGRHARRIHQAARSHRRRAACDSGREVHDAGRRVLCVSECVGIFREERDEVRRRHRARACCTRRTSRPWPEKASGRRSMFASPTPRRWKIWIRRWSGCGSSSARCKLGDVHRVTRVDAAGYSCSAMQLLSATVLRSMQCSSGELDT